MTPAIFGIENDGLSLAVNLLILFLVVLYLAMIAYVFLDARRRLDDSVLVGCATVAALFPFVGPLVYSILRPPEFREDARERELEIRASELRLRQLQEQSCPNCEFPVEREFLRCPSCRARIKDPCESCGKPIDPRWSLCPYCETPTRRPEPAARRSGGGGERAPRTPRPTRSKRPAATGQAQPRASAAKPDSRAPAAKPKQRSTATSRSAQATRKRTERPGDDSRPAPAS